MGIRTVLLTLSLVTTLSSFATAGALDQAIAGAAVAGYPVPPGWTVQFAPAAGAMGLTDHASQTISIDPAVIDSVVPGLTTTSSSLPGVLEQVLIHEIMHTSDGGGTGAGGNTPCIEAPHQVEVAEHNCELATALANLGISNQNLCAFFNEIRSYYNGTNPNSSGGAAKAWAAAGCSGTAPEMPGCEACPEGG